MGRTFALTVVSLMVLALGGGLGLVTYALSTWTQSATAAAPTTTPIATQAAAKAPATVVQGGVYTTVYLDRLWVDDVAVTLWNRSENNRDRRAMDALDDLYENFFIQPGTRVRVLVTFGSVSDLKHLEVVDGPDAGRRGWTDTYSDNQYLP